MSISFYKEEEEIQMLSPYQGKLSRGMLSRWMAIGIMAAFFFPLTITVILVNGSGFGLLLAAIVSLLLVVVANFWALNATFWTLILGLGITLDMVIIITSFVIK